MPEQVKLMNMCMITDPQGRVLVQHRKKGDWDGLTFPGGKVEPGELLTQAVIREVWEETGLTISHPKICGTKEWNEPDCRVVLLFYKTNEYTGEIRDSAEGHMEWMTLEELQRGNMAMYMDMMLRVFQEDDIAQMYFIDNHDGTWTPKLM